MRYEESSIKEARKRKGLTQEALAAASGVSRITVARVESGQIRGVRAGTLEKLCGALDLEFSVARRGTQTDPDRLLARERERAKRLDARRRHAALAAALLALDPAAAEATVERARGNVERWERDQLCSEHYIRRWRDRLQGPLRTVALRLLEHGEWTDALLQNSPWSFALEPSAT